MVSWEEIPPFDRNGIIIAYEVLYEPLNTFDGLLEVETMSTTTEQSTILSDLQEFVDYNITVRVYTSAGPGPYSDMASNMTYEDGKIYILWALFVPIIKKITLQNQVALQTMLSL